MCFAISKNTVFDWRHYLAVLQRKPGALRNGAPFTELPLAFRTLQQRMLKTPGGDREMVEILASSSSMTSRPGSLLRHIAENDRRAREMTRPNARLLAGAFSAATQPRPSPS